MKEKIKRVTKNTYFKAKKLAINVFDETKIRWNKKIEEIKENKPKAALRISLYLLIAVMLLIFIISFSIILPIIFKPFYYWHIKPYEIDEKYFSSGQLSYEQISTIYSNLVHWLLGFGTNDEFTFKTAIEPLRYTKDGYEHFVDVRNLFSLAFILFFVSIAVLTIAIGFSIKYKLKISIINIGFYSMLLLMFVLIIIAILASQDFNAAFTKFHEIFFRGKDNWLFSPNKDEIIKMLPQEFFRNCAIWIGVNITFFFVLFVALKAKKSIKNIIKYKKLNSEEHQAENA
ncbi:TIGR01906 family membrane protein [Mycoplasma sp. Pen4]|uniref:TIGR01906 family membrane protein n=1 Tax=Mycoplasma sp. Pen4 TaxID=640330 RepID=UPI0016540720|nr:TIGR01906 family membrane protein [Mycoplasma sp. Pen4]QNM93693.1 TIGR01906 family membrane protein [Mycoplasma sp. Pen4]